MKLHKKVIGNLMVAPGEHADLERRSTSQTKTGWLDSGSKSAQRDLAERDLVEFTAELEVGQELLYASDTRAVLVILQGLDAAGKDVAIKHVLSGVNPQGCDVVSFKQPTVDELNHDFLWRCAKRLPGQGRIGIFNRSYYEEVLVTRVHPELIAEQHLPDSEETGDALWEQRYEDINAFERHLVATTPLSSSFSSTSQRKSRPSGSQPDWTTQKSIGSSRLRTSPNAPTSMITREPTKPRSARPQRSGRPGTWSPLTTSTRAVRLSGASSPTASKHSTSNCPKRMRNDSTYWRRRDTS